MLRDMENLMTKLIYYLSVYIEKAMCAPCLFPKFQFYMTKKNITTTLLFVALYSCSPHHQETVPVETLEGRMVVLDSAYYGMKATQLCGNLLFTWSKSPEETCCIGVLSRDSLTNYQGGFCRGHGHNEFQEVVVGQGKDSCIYIVALPSTYNRILSLTKIDETESIETLKNAEVWKKYALSDLPAFRCSFDDFISISDSTILVPGAPYGDIEHLMSIIDFKNRKLMPLDYWPEDGSQVSGFVKLGVYTDNCRLLGDGTSRFLYVCGEGNFAFIFSIEGNSVKVIKELYSLLPQYEYMGDDKIGRMNYIIKNRPIRRFRPDANSDHIYVLLQEKDIEGDFAENWRTSVCGNIVEVYDWDGNLEKKIELDHLGDDIKVSAKDDLLYLFSENPKTGDPEIWVYDL